MFAVGFLGMFGIAFICSLIMAGLHHIAIKKSKTTPEPKPVKDAFACPDPDCGLVVISNNETYLKFLAAEHVEYHELANEDAATFRQINGA